MSKYRCKVCSYVETSLEELPDDYKCPVCGVGKDQFDQVHLPADEGQEKHVPVVEATDGGVRVKVGSIPHPMEEAHYITLVELYDGGTVFRKAELKPGEDSGVFFEGMELTDSMYALAHCNLHGIWTS